MSAIGRRGPSQLECLGGISSLNVDAGYAGAFVTLDGTKDVRHRFASLVGIDDEGDCEGVRHPAGLVDHLGWGEDPAIGNGVVHHGGGMTAHVRRVKAGLLDDPARQCAVAVGSHERRTGIDQRAQCFGRTDH
jgi:hypothetical protein